jgi:hypothetical protein
MTKRLLIFLTLALGLAACSNAEVSGSGAAGQHSTGVQHISVGFPF